MAATGLGDLYSPLGMLEIVETARSYDLFAFRPHLHTGCSGTCWNLRCREGHSSQGALRKIAMPWAGADDLKKKKKSIQILRVGGGKERSPSAVEIALSASVSGWLVAGSDKN